MIKIHYIFCFDIISFFSNGSFPVKIMKVKQNQLKKIIYYNLIENDKSKAITFAIVSYFILQF